MLRTELSPEQWNWTEKEDPPFHAAAYNSLLVKYHDRLTPEQKTGRVFVPLCGKTLDMIFLSEQRYEVVGLEFSEIGIVDFFAENNLTYDKEELVDSPFVKYTAKERNITIYKGDLFDLSRDVCGDFDASWDRGSFVAVNVPTRKKYAQLMSSIIRPSGKILMEVWKYNPSKYAGPPHHTEEKDIVETFTDFKVKVLEFNPTKPHFYSGDDIMLGAVLLSH